MSEKNSKGAAAFVAARDFSADRHMAQRDVWADAHPTKHERDRQRRAQMTGSSYSNIRSIGSALKRR